MEIPAIHANACHKLSCNGVFKIMARTEFTVTVTGLTFANDSSHDGIVSIGTKMELANIRGKTHKNPAT